MVALKRTLFPTAIRFAIGNGVRRKRSYIAVAAIDVCAEASEFNFTGAEF